LKQLVLGKKGKKEGTDSAGAIEKGDGVSVRVKGLVLREKVMAHGRKKRERGGTAVSAKLSVEERKAPTPFLKIYF